VTKVLLRPVTGRRHQLRLHCYCLGHPIVGDYTYDPHREREALATSSITGAIATTATRTATCPETHEQQRPLPEAQELLVDVGRYQNDYYDRVETSEEGIQAVVDSSATYRRSARMMLHAHSLR
jgi:hypothetical protein